MLHHCTADHLPGVLPVGQHDALVHDNSLSRLRGRLPGHSDDVKVWRFVGISGRRGFLSFITFTRSGVNKTSVQRRGRHGATTGEAGPHAVIETTRNREFPVGNIFFLDRSVSLTQHRRGRGAAARHCARDRVILPVVDDRGDSSLES